MPQIIFTILLLIFAACAPQKQIAIINTVDDEESSEKASVLFMDTLDNLNDAGNLLKDARDLKKYKIVKIGTQTWMAENLNYEANGSECYDNKPENCTKYGRLYDWQTAKKVCPKGWHLPSYAELDTLIVAVGGEATAGAKLKAKSDWAWVKEENANGNGTDDYDFSALPSGKAHRPYSNEAGDYEYWDIGYYGYWWSSDSNLSNEVYVHGLQMSYYKVNVAWQYLKKTAMFSVRCLQDRLTNSASGN